MQASLARHDELLRSSIEAHGGYVFSTAGDAFSAAFATSGDAVAAALAAQRALQGESWPAPTEIRVRMGLHVGAAHERGGDYFGSAVNRAARVMALARGGQIVVSEAVQHLVRHELPEGARLVGLGRHALRGMSEPESVFQLGAPDLIGEFAPLAASGTVPGNLPLPATSFVGRVDQVKRLSARTNAASSCPDRRRSVYSSCGRAPCWLPGQPTRAGPTPSNASPTRSGTSPTTGSGHGSTRCSLPSPTIGVARTVSSRRQP